MKLYVFILIVCFNIFCIENTAISADQGSFDNDKIKKFTRTNSKTTGATEKTKRIRREISETGSETAENDKLAKAGNSEQDKTDKDANGSVELTKFTTENEGITASTTEMPKNSHASLMSKLTFGLKKDKIKDDISVRTKDKTRDKSKDPKEIAKSPNNDTEDKVLKVFAGGHENQTEEEQKKTDKLFTPLQKEYGRKCFKDIGCFSAIAVTLSSKMLPSSPMSPQDIKPVFHLYTVEERTIPVNFSYDASQAVLKNTAFNPKLKTVFIIHGFQSGFELWMENVKDFLFLQSRDNVNVFVVVWTKGSKVLYNQAVTNTRVVGALIAFFIDTLCQAFEITNDQFWLIGNNLGAHLSGYAGKRLSRPKLGRITALDPTGLSFNYLQGGMRLHPDDAALVDVIHTDTTGYGTTNYLGHYDIYPNGGYWQPGCPKSGGFMGSIESCSHIRSMALTTNLDKPDDVCSAMAYQCESYETFLEGRCADCSDNKCQPMGLNQNYWIGHKPNKAMNRTYFINTALQEDFCLNHYQLALHIDKDSDSGTGILVFTIDIQNDNTTDDISFQRIITKTQQKKIHTVLVTFDKRLEITSESKLFVDWKRFNDSEKVRINRGYKLKVPVIELNYMSAQSQSERDKYSIIFCPKEGEKSTLIVNQFKTEYIKCEPQLANSARTTDSKEMKPLTAREDIYSVNYKNINLNYKKIKKSNFR